MPLLGWFVIRGLALARINLFTRFEVSNSAHYKDMMLFFKVLIT